VTARNATNQLVGALEQDTTAMMHIRVLQRWWDGLTLWLGGSSMKRAEQTSFFYLLLALGCFDRAHRVRHGASLRSIGRDYVRKATKFTSKSQPQLTVRRVMNEAA
jgi:hypothetical protein